MGRSSVLGDYFSQGYQSVPHIIPGVLYPAIKDSGGTVRLLDRTTAHSGNYGTAQSDDRKYYYTDIKGSKPIRDPRIGAHFGSQRHMFRSLQLLEQETATHGLEVHSGDGREWMRFVGNSWTIRNDSYGNQLALYGVNVNTDTTNFIEIVGYFSGANMSGFTNHDAPDTIDCVIDGTDTGSNGSLATSAANPLVGRYVDSGSFINLPLGSTSLGIHTLRINPTNSSSETNYFMIGALELIAQDTGTTARRSQINIPAQNVVSYGKRFSIGSDTLTDSVHTHYDPFNGFTDDTTLFSAKVDTATSLGLGTATTWGAAWDTGSDDHIRPFNGGRVVKWIDSDGTIKTSVTMMPRNAQNIGTTASNEITDVSSTNSHTINFSDDAVEHSLSEVAKTFHLREFGNGAANGNTSAANYADASMLSGTADDIAYVMDDGLSSFSGNSLWISAATQSFVQDGSSGKNLYITFIGTGISILQNSVTHGGSDSFKYYIDGILVKTWSSGTVPEWQTIAQNLPYGTHILRMELAGVSTTREYWREVTFHQPKRPPIPEHACVIADYMLMADFVPITSQNSNLICKGVRRQNSSRDIFYEETDDNAFNFHMSTQPEGFGVEIDGAGADNATSFKARIPSFGTNIVHRGYASVSRSQIYVDSTSQTTTDDSTTNNYGSYQYIATSKTLGVYNWGTNAITGNNGNITSFEIVTPIHTSHHYKTFETPFLHELIGGDRNMEQTHLICSPDGKTWDEITRDTSYIGTNCLLTYTDTDHVWGTFVIMDEWRGSRTSGAAMDGYMNKDFAIAYDRVICLVDGFYEISVMSRYLSASDLMVYVGDTHPITATWTDGSDYGPAYQRVQVGLQRGQYIRVRGEFGHGGNTHDFFQITRVVK